MRTLQSKRWPWARTFVCALVALGLTLSATFVATPAAQASGPGPCAAITSTDQAQAAVAPAGGVTARLSRTQGTVGTALSVTGAGWPANTFVVVNMVLKKYNQIGVDAVAVAHAMTSASGALDIPQFHAPNIIECESMNVRSPDGGTMMFLVHTLDGRARQPLVFTYLPSPTLTSSMTGVGAVAGATMTLTGAGWESNETVTITPMTHSAYTSYDFPFAPLPNAAFTVTADASGAFTISYRLPNVPPETEVALSVQANGPRFGDVSYLTEVDYTTLPTIFPSIHLSEIAVNPGGALTVTGEHWLPQRPIIIEYCRGENTIAGMVGLRCDPLLAEQLAIVQADASGHFSARVRLPANARLGSVTVQARIPGGQFGLVVYAQGQPLAIAPTYAEAHPRLMALRAAAPYLAGSALALLALLGALAARLLRARRRGGTGDAEPAL